MTTTVATNGIDVDSTLKKVDKLKDKSLRLPKPAGYKMLVALPQIEEKTAGGIIKAQSTLNREATAANVGFVISLGADAYQDKEKFPNGAWCDVGDYVCYAKYSGQKFIYKGMKLLLIFDDQVIMKVEKPSLLDPTYHLSN